VELARAAEKLGAGEIVLNSIDRDGVMRGYDLDLAREIRAAISIPMTVMGGAGSLADIGVLLREFGLVGAAAGSLFVFKGVYRAVLISYPDRGQRTLCWEGYWCAERPGQPTGAACGKSAPHEANGPLKPSPLLPARARKSSKWLRSMPR